MSARLPVDAARRAAALAIVACALAGLPIIASAVDAPPDIALLPADQVAAVACRTDVGSALILGQPMPIDRADAKALELLPGVGPKRAQAIAAARPTRVDDLADVRGVGPKRLASIRALLTDPSPTPARPCR